jgi:hypothetical protein
MLASIPCRAGLPELLGVRPGTVLAYEAVFEACTAFHHSNLRLPLGVERHLVNWLVTPRAHGIHHSVVHRETQSNFGVGLTLWDRLHQTLRLNVPQAKVTIGAPLFLMRMSRPLSTSCYYRWLPCAPGLGPMAPCRSARNPLRLCISWQNNPLLLGKIRLMTGLLI